MAFIALDAENLTGDTVDQLMHVDLGDNKNPLFKSTSKSRSSNYDISDSDEENSDKEEAEELFGAEVKESLLGQIPETVLRYLTTDILVE